MMRFTKSSTTFRQTLLGATSLALVLTVATAASAASTEDEDAERPTGSEESPGIVIRNDLNPNAPPPSGVLDSGINGVGQMTVRGDPNTTGMNLCTGTLINPRTVIFAAHCVNTRPAEAYGVNGTPFGAHTNGGTPIAFGFEANNLPAVRQWLGLDGGTAGATNVARALYAVEQVWYDPRSLTTPGSNRFIVADVAIATLDTPAFDIPSWAMLFSPLDGPTHATITGYGNAGRENQSAAGTPGGIAIDWRRRSAENMISVLGSLNDRNSWLFGSSGTTNNLYLLDFRDPNPAYNPAAGKFDFGLYGSDPALPREGTTAGGDSGGPLIVDQKYDIPVIAGVLSGGSRFFGAQQFHNYGSDSFFQPLHLYWDLIVANNPYVYAGNKEGNGNWEDGSHWVQLMDPSYMIDVDGKLVNGLPDTPAQGIAPGGAKFGQICFLTDCTTLSGTQASGDGTAVFVPGGPGSTDFVPNNRSANPAAGVRARYYDVTLSAAGTTTLSSSVTIDRMALDGQTRLDVKSGGSLNVLGTYNQIQGWTNVDGRIQSGRDMLIVSGMLSGSGTIKAPFVTVVGGIVAPGGGDRIGTLNVDGNMILASGSSLFIDASRTGADRLAVNGTLALNGGALVFNQVTRGAAPRHGQRFDIATANQVIGTFGEVFTFQGVLRPEITYTDTAVTAELRAGSLVTILTGQNRTALAFAGALDQLRSTSYNQLFGLFGAIDLMGAQQLSATLNSLAPRITGETRSLQDRQSRVMLNSVTDRLSSLGTKSLASGLSFIGSPTALATMDTAHGVANEAFSSLVPGSTAVGVLPKGMSGFISGGIVSDGAGYGAARTNVQSQMSSHMGMGLELEVSQGFTFGTAFGVSRGYSSPGTDRTESRMNQVAVYGSYRLGGGAYVAGVASTENSQADMQRRGFTGDVAFDLHGATNSSRYSVMSEAGVNLDVVKGLILTPRAQVSFASYRLGGFREGGSEAALLMDDLRIDGVEARVGAMLAGSTSVGRGWALMPQFQADYVNMFAGANAGLRVSFVNANDVSFLLPIGGGDSSWAEARGGFRLVNGNLAIGAGLETTVGRSDVRNNRAMADFSFRF
jgi:subtilase-type serine protease